MTLLSKNPTVRVRLKKPDFLRKRFRPGGRAEVLEQLIGKNLLHTVCQSAHCPNQNECFSAGTATFLLMGELCTRHCPFCAIAHGENLGPLDWKEPERLLQTVRAMALRFVVITSINRDDLTLGGADMFAACITILRENIQDIRIEVLTPDFLGNESAIDIVSNASPDIYNHNVETVPALYRQVRPEGEYQRSLDLLRRVHHTYPQMALKSGLMVGLGERPEQVLEVFDDLVQSGCTLLTVGQYLAPSGSRHLPVREYVAPEQFDIYRQEALNRGFQHVASGPFVRSSYMAHVAWDALESSKSIIGENTICRGHTP